MRHGWQSSLRGLLLVGCLLLLVSACRSQPVTVTREPVTLSLVAADSCEPLVEHVPATYEASRPWVTVSVDVVNAMLVEESLREGGADIGLLPELETPREEQVLWTEEFVRDGIALIVHPESPFTEIGMAQLREIFRGRLQEWDGIVLTVVSRESGSSTRAVFESIVLDDQDTTLNAVVVPSSEAMIEYVATVPSAIGYVSTLHLNNRVRVLPVDGVSPSKQAVGAGRYPLWRQIYMASKGEPTGEVRDFAQWLLMSGEGLVR